MIGIFVVISLIICLIATVIGAILMIKQKWDWDSETAAPWFIIAGGAGMIISVIVILLNIFVIIDDGEVGVEVLFGKIQEQTLNGGWNNKNLFSDVYKYSIRLHEYTMSVTTGEGQVANPDGVTIRTKDDSEMTVDCTIWWSIDPESAFNIYKKISQTDTGIQDILIRPAIRSVLRDIGANYTLNTIMDERIQYGVDVHKALVDSLEGKGVIIDRVNIREIKPPTEVDLAIEAKLKAEQDLAAMEFRLEMEEKEAEIKIAEARGIAEAQEIINERLTPLYVQYLAVKNYELMASSPNTTFIIAPTSPNGTGMPLILNAK